jgi:holin-like protein
MTTRQFAVACRRSLHLSRLAQIALLCGLWGVGELIARWARLPIPGGVVGMAIALALLASGRLSLVSVRRGADWLLAEMLLFFVPAVLAILDHRELFGWLGLKVLAVILAGTVTVMTVTALTVDLCLRLAATHGRAGHALD